MAAKTITIVTGSARSNSVGATLVPLVQKELEKQGATVRLADLKELDMPFVDAEIIPSAEDFVPPHDSVKQWQDIVTSSDGLILLAPEYNSQISAIQKNAFDWLYTDWIDKPIAIVGYGWSGATTVVELLNKLITRVGAKPLTVPAQLYFKKDIELDGTILDAETVESKIAAAVEELVADIGDSKLPR